VESLITIFALVIGWALNEASHYIRASKEHKAAIANALSILLEIRFQAVVIDAVMDEIKRHGASGEIIPSIRTLIDNIMQHSTALDDEYTESMKTVARTAPLLAYEYRSRNTMPSFLSSWRAIAAEHGMPLKEIEEMEAQLKSIVIPKLNELIIFLANVYSRKSAKAVKKIIETPVEIPKEISGLLENSNRNS